MKHLYKYGAEKGEIKKFIKRYGAKGKSIYFKVVEKVKGERTHKRLKRR